jgi:hypothetical protein
MARCRSGDAGRANANRCGRRYAGAGPGAAHSQGRLPGCAGAPPPRFPPSASVSPVAGRCGPRGRSCSDAAHSQGATGAATGGAVFRNGSSIAPEAVPAGRCWAGHGTSLLPAAGGAGGAEDRLGSSSHPDRFGCLRRSRCCCRGRSGGGLLLQRRLERTGGQRCVGVRRQAAAPAGGERAGRPAAAGGTRHAQLAAGVEEGSRQDD